VNYQSNFGFEPAPVVADPSPMQAIAKAYLPDPEIETENGDKP
jgi:hypothetical protein